MGNCNGYADCWIIYSQFSGRRACLLITQVNVRRHMQISALADMIQAALMLRYNKRKVG